MIVALANEALLPATWKRPDVDQRIRAFNPSLLPDRDGWIFAYRIVTEPDLTRRIALCRLDANLGIIPGTPLPFSDWVRFAPDSFPSRQATTWFADPRVYRLQGRVFVYWNSGWHEPQNHQFLQEIDPTSLRPIAPARELVLKGTRQKLEKNWGIFEHDRCVYAVYSINPHRVLSLSLEGEGPIDCADIAPGIGNDRGYAQQHGGLRGGAPPQRLGQHFYSFCHSIENDAEGYRYVPAVYRFAATAPFRPTAMPRSPLPMEIPASLHRQLPKLNPAIGHIVYPAGAAHVNGKWHVSIGVNDERCAIAIMDDADVARTLDPGAPG